MKKRKIMIVEDDEDVREGLVMRIEANGYETVEASSAKQAIEMARQEPPDLMILDIGLPDGDAFTIVETLGESAHFDSTSVILVTGRDPEDFKQRAYDIGVKAFFLKPVDNKKLLSAMRQMLKDGEEEPQTDAPV